MDSMRSLNSSLPGGKSPSKQQNSEPPQQALIAHFKAAALSVTNLYKTAAADQGRARAEGYQDALDDLLIFLDKKDIGLSDGEGWRIRRWATERLDGREALHNDSDDEVPEKTDSGSPPVVHRSQTSTHIPASTPKPTRAASPMRAESAPPPPTVILPDPEPPTITALPQGTFTFRSSQQYPQDPDILLSDLDLSDKGCPQIHDGFSNQPAGISLTRPLRTNARHNNHTSRLNARSSTAIGRGAGQKRKINFGDFFDLGNLGHGDDSSAFGGWTICNGLDDNMPIQFRGPCFYAAFTWGGDDGASGTEDRALEGVK
ncbi:hypothetical protein SBOR_3843 [Sclerotinia borealis F-4128]|uniref:Uncharacterized protein n=1 Tax=Sclerotinia borealis (strain F-4128) TaxID=1432307 RepID=W9CM89_SCLBF|nr:hypothetical protein SBOR_3843 [Sclerotinia borealis F-4128]